MKIDNYVLDLHTKKIEWSPGCLENFAKIGAFIRNENVNFLHPEYREIYLLLKKELDLYRSRGRQTTMIPNNLEILCQKTGVRIEKLSKQTMAKVDDAPHAQKRTSDYKKAVHLVGDLVFKGPYKPDNLRLTKNLERTYAIQLLEATLRLDEWQRGSLRWEYLGCWDDDQCYLVAVNVGKRKNISSELKNSGVEKNVKVVPRKEHVYRVSEIEGTEQLTGEIRSAALQHLYLRFLLDIGDSGTHNILKRDDRDSAGRRIAGVDLEEVITNKVKVRRSKEKKQRLNLLFKKEASEKLVALYESDVCKIKSLSYDQLDQHTLDRMKAVGIDLGRLKANAELWEGVG
jgi:hypothetical protein